MLAFFSRAVKTEGGFCFWGCSFRTAHSPITGANAELKDCPCPSLWLLAAPLAPFSGGKGNVEAASAAQECL
jgi:hypothetical protein